MATTRRQCLIEGEDIVFSVTTACDDAVSDLKEFIQSERALDSLKDVDPHTLELWKPKESIATKPRKGLVERLADDLSKFAVEFRGHGQHLQYLSPTTSQGLHPHNCKGPVYE